MPKGDGLTGGTRDVNPQWYRTKVVSPVITTAALAVGAGAIVASTSMAAFPLPISRLQQKSGKSVVVELLKVQWDHEFSVPVSFAADSSFTALLQGFLATAPSAAPGLGTTTPLADVYQESDPAVLDFYDASVSFCVDASAPATNGGLVAGRPTSTPIIHDLTDGAGHGILIATDNVFLGAQQNIALYTTPAGNYSTTVFCNLLYRFKEVSLQEYIGIVQSQQNAPRFT